MNTNTITNIFSAETIETNSFKVLFEIIEKNFPNGIVNFKVNKNGIFIFMVNQENDLIIDFELFSKYMNKFEFNHEEEATQGAEFLFGVSILELIEIRKTIKKKDIISLSVEKDSRNLNIKIFKNIFRGELNPSYLIPILGIQNYINVIPTYKDFPINLNNSKKLYSLWKKNTSKDDGVNIQLFKNTIILSFHDTRSIIIGESSSTTLELLYEDTFKKELITNIIKIASFGTLRIYYDSSNLLFSAMIGCGSGNINLYVSPNY